MLTAISELDALITCEVTASHPPLVFLTKYKKCSCCDIMSLRIEKRGGGGGGRVRNQYAGSVAGDVVNMRLGGFSEGWGGDASTRLSLYELANPTAC